MTEFQVAFYQDSDWEQIRLFISDNWSSSHPLLNKTFFDWQFNGFGEEKNKIKSLLLKDNGKIIGMRGIIPGIYQVPLDKNNLMELQGGSFSMWMIRKEYRKRRLGLLLHMEAQKNLNVISGAGSNPKTSLPIYLKNDFKVLEAMNRYVMPLSMEYQELLSEKVELQEIVASMAVLSSNQEPLTPKVPNPNDLEKLWKDVTFPLGIFSILRNTDFWKWRYLSNVGFDYLFWGNPNKTGIVVGHIETIISDEISQINGKTVFRIIEMIPRSKSVWQGEMSQDFQDLLLGVLAWARQKGCLAVDFYCSTSRFEHILNNVGLRKQNPDLGPPLSSLAVLFQPLKYKANLINALYRIDIPGYGFICPNFYDTYMVKSENDMDRPKVNYNR